MIGASGPLSLCLGLHKVTSFLQAQAAPAEEAAMLLQFKIIFHKPNKLNCSSPALEKTIYPI